MIIYHTTLVRNLDSILRWGLLTRYAQQGRRAVWACTKSLQFWSFLHVARRHGSVLEGIVTLKLSVPRSWLRRHTTGVYWCPRDIPAERIVEVISYEMVSRSPVAQEASE